MGRLKNSLFCYYPLAFILCTHSILTKQLIQNITTYCIILFHISNKQSILTHPSRVCTCKKGRDNEVSINNM